MKLPSLSTKAKIVTGAVVIAVFAGGVSAQLASHPTPLKSDSSGSSTHGAAATELVPTPSQSISIPSKQGSQAPVGGGAGSSSVSTGTTTSSGTGGGTNTPPATPVTVTSSTFSGTNDAGVCNLVYSDSSTGQVPATITKTHVDVNVYAYSDNCQSFVGQNK